MWQTVSARLRGAKSELNDMGEDTEDMVTSTSKLRKQVMALTGGFDIMKDENTFKDIYEIMLGIGKVWEDMSDVDQAALLELLAGKRQSNALAAVLTNVDTLQKAYESAENSAGSAEAEQERYTKGIAYSMGQFKASVEELNHTLISSELVKFFVDFGTGAIKALDDVTGKLKTFPVLFNAIIASMSVKSGKNYITGIGTSIIDSISNTAQYQTAQKQYFADQMDGINAVDFTKRRGFLSTLFGNATARRFSSATETVGNKLKQYQENGDFNLFAQSLGIADKDAIKALEDYTNQFKTTTDVLEQESLKGKIAMLTLEKGAKDLGTTGAAAISHFGKAIAGFVVQQALIMGVSYALGKVVQAMHDYKHAFEDASTAMNNAFSEADQHNSKIESTRKQLEEIKKQLDAIHDIGNVQLIDPKEEQRLLSQQKVLERILTIEQALKNVSTEKAWESAEKAYNAQGDLLTSYDAQAFIQNKPLQDIIFDATNGGNVDYVTPTGDLGQQLKELQRYYTTIDEGYQTVMNDIDSLAEKYHDNLTSMTKEDSDRLNELQTEQKRYETERESRLGEMATLANQISGAYQDAEAKLQRGEQLTPLEQKYHDLYETTSDFISANQETATEFSRTEAAFNKVGKAAVQTKEEMAQTQATVDAMVKSYTDLNALLTSQKEGASVALDADQLKEYGGMLEYVNGVYRLNTEEVKKNAIEKAKNTTEEIKHQKALAQAQYVENARNIEKYTEALAKGAKLKDGILNIDQKYIDKLKQTNKEILENCTAYDYQIKQLRNVSTAYQEWLSAGSVDEDSEMYKNMDTAIERSLEAIQKNKLSKRFYEDLKVILPVDFDVSDTNAVKKYLDYVNGLTTEDSSGIAKFLKLSTEKGLMTESNGDYEIAPGVTIEKFMEDLNLSETMVRALLSQLEIAHSAELEFEDGSKTLGDEIIKVKSETDKLMEEYENLQNKPSRTQEESERLKELISLISDGKIKYKELKEELEEKVSDPNTGILQGENNLEKILALRQFTKIRNNTTLTNEEYIKQLNASMDKLRALYGDDFVIKLAAHPEFAPGEIEREKEELQNQLNLDPLEIQLAVDFYNEQVNTLEKDINSGKYDPETVKKFQEELDKARKALAILNELNTITTTTGTTTSDTPDNNSIPNQIKNIAGILEDILAKIPSEPGYPSASKTGDLVTMHGLGEDLPKSTNTTQKVDLEYTSTGAEDFINSANTASEAAQNLGTSAEEAGKKSEATAPKIHKLAEEGDKVGNANTYFKENYTQAAAHADALTRSLNGLTDAKNRFLQTGGGTPTTTGDSGGNDGSTGKTTAKGTAFANGTDVVGEQGRELVVDPHRGIWYTVGDTGTEMIDLPKDAIVYSHNQTEALLKSGVTSRGKSTGKSFAEGNAHADEIVTGKIHISDSGSDTAKNAKKAEKSAEKIADSAKETEEKAEQVYDWVERALDYSSRQVEQIRDIVDDETLSYQERLSFAESLIELDKEHIDALEQARDIRSQEYSEAVQKMREGLTPELFEEIQMDIEHGNLDLEKYKTNFTELFGEDGEKKYQLVVDTVEAYDNITELSDKLQETEKQLREDTMKPYELRLNVIKSEMEELNSVADELQHNLDMKDILGIAVTEGDYTRQIDNAKDKLENLGEQLDVLQEKADETEYGSDEWYQVQQEIASVNKEMMDLNRSIAEWNYQIKRLPIERISKHLRMLANIKTDIENSAFSEPTYGSEATEKAIKETASILNKEKDLYLEQAQLVRNLRNEMEYGSEKWHELDDELQGIEDKIKDIVNQIKEMAKQILQLPIDAIEKQNAQLQKMADYLQKDQDRYDAILAAVNEVYDTERERIEQERDYLNEQLQDEIDKYQDVLDLLNEQNEARRVRIDLENAQYNLDKARQQRNIQVVRNGRIEYDSDMSAVRDAEQGLNDAEYSKRQYDLQQSIDKLSKRQEENNDKAEEALKALEEGQKPWSEIADQHQKIANASQALALFGEGWEDRIKSGNDQQMREYFDGLYQDNQAEIEANRKQTEQNEEVIGVLTAIEDALDSGNITAERAEELRASLQTAVDSNVLSNDTIKKFYLDLYGADSTRGLNDNVEAAVRQIYTDYGKQIEQASVKYAEAEQLQQVLNEFTEAEDNEAKIAKENSETLKKIEQNTAKSSSRRRSNRRDDDDDDENDPGEFSKNPTRYGAHTSKNPYSGTLTGDEVESRRATDDNTEAVENLTKAVDEWSRDYQEAHGATGPARDLEPHSDGLKYGPVGMMSSSDKFKMLQKLSLTKLDPDEVPTLLHRGEAVLNQNQINTVLENMATLSRQSLAPVPVSNSRSSTTQINMTFGDLNLPNVHDANSFAESIKMNFELAMNQQFSKR